METKHFTPQQVDEYAEKLLIKLTTEENKMVLDEFEQIDATIDLINQIPNIQEVEPMTHCLDDFIYELREDVKEETVPIEELLKNCDDKVEGEVRLPKVVTEA